MAKDGKSTYYDVGGIEVIDVIKAKLTPEQYTGFVLGNALKYQMRMMHKNPEPLSDAKKAAFYSKELTDLFEQPEPISDEVVGDCNEYCNGGKLMYDSNGVWWRVPNPYHLDSITDGDKYEKMDRNVFNNLVEVGSFKMVNIQDIDGISVTLVTDKDELYQLVGEK